MKDTSVSENPNNSPALRAAITEVVLSALPEAGTAAALKNLAAAAAKPESEPLSRRAALFALDNFRALQGEVAPDGISEERLYKLLRYGSFSPEPQVTALLSYLHKNIGQIGHVVGTRESRSFVAAGGFAMPVTFKVKVHAIDALDLIKAICAGAKAA